MIVVAATGIERRRAGGTLVPATQIVADAQFGATGSAQNCELVPLIDRPHLGGVPGQLIVALAAGIVGFAAPQLERDDVSRL